MARAAIYVRISQDRAGERLGVTDQREDCEAHAAALGHEVVGVYEDDDRSAYSGKPRPAWDRLWEDVAAGGIDVVIAVRDDRLYRRMRDLEDVIDLAERHKVTLSLARSGVLDLSTASGRHVARVLGSTAVHSSDVAAERIKRAALRRAKAGSPSGGPRPYGYAADGMGLHPVEADAMRDAAQRILAGEALASVCRSLNDRGLVGTKGGRWQGSTLRTALIRPRYAGLREHGSGDRHGRAPEILGDAAWPALWDRAHHERLRRVLLDPSRNRKRNGPRKHLLAGMLWCGRCGSPMSSHPSNGKPGYLCKDRYEPSKPDSCGATKVVAEPLHGEVVGQYLASVDHGGLARHLAPREDPALGEAEAELRAVADRREELAAEYGSGRLSAALLGGIDADLTSREEAATATLSRARRGSPLEGLPVEPGALRARWPGLPVTRQQALLRVLIDRVIVHAARPDAARNRFDPRRVEVRWR